MIFAVSSGKKDLALIFEITVEYQCTDPNLFCFVYSELMNINPYSATFNLQQTTISNFAAFKK